MYIYTYDCVHRTIGIAFVNPITIVFMNMVTIAIVITFEVVISILIVVVFAIPIIVIGVRTVFDVVIGSVIVTFALTRTCTLTMNSIFLELLLLSLFPCCTILPNA